MSQGFSKATKAMCMAGLKSESMRMRELKREHAMMRRWLEVLIGRTDPYYKDDYLLAEIRAKMPSLFKEAR